MTRFAHPSPYGTHRVLDALGPNSGPGLRPVLPQPAWRLDAALPIASNEILIDVHTLNVDSASFTQIEAEAAGDAQRIAARVAAIVAERGKLHNPVTGSGGMLVGSVREVGAALAGRADVKPGDRIATLVSLSLTPLVIDRIKAVHPGTDQIDIEGTAVLFETGLFAKLPADIPERTALAILDVAGAPAQTARLAKPGDTVLVIGGGGKSGTLCCYEAMKRVGRGGRVIAASPFEVECRRMRELGWVHHAVQADATDALGLMQAVAAVTDGRLADLTINCVNVPHTEMGSILATREGGTVYFFSMATSFTAAALGAEGVGKDVQMLVGNGYARGHAEHVLGLLRESAKLRQLFEERYA